MKISVIIPTYKRVSELRRCLDALAAQTRPSDEIIIVVRNTDTDTLNFIVKNGKSYRQSHLVTVEKGGQVNALNAGLNTARGDILVFTDDDAVPNTEWLKRIEEHYAKDGKAGAVGGRDYVYVNGNLIKGNARKVGLITWYGRVIGNHHLGTGRSRYVDHLKGANMSFRRAAIEGLMFDTRLRGEGAQYLNDMEMCLSVKKRRWKIIYDPAITIDHYYAERFEEDKRGDYNLNAIRAGAHNETLVFLGYLPLPKGITVFLFLILIGSKFTPGVVQYIRIFFSGGKNPFARFLSSILGRIDGIRTLKNK